MSVKKVDGGDDENKIETWVINPHTVSSQGYGTRFIFTAFENKLVKWVLERHGFRESTGDGQSIVAVDWIM